MTALRKYDRLESSGLWRDTPLAQRREVVVAFREATLVLSDPRSEMALSHWSLPAVVRLNAGEVPALYGPGPEDVETLEIDDPEMIAALDTIRRVLVRRRARPGRLRNFLLTGATLAVLALGLVWMPSALIRHTATVLPAVSRAEIGRVALADLQRLTGPVCDNRLGTRAAFALKERLFGTPNVTLLVVPDAVKGTVSLPGGLIVLGRGLIETPPDAEAAAGFALVEAARMALQDPMIPLLTYAGVPATFRLLTTGHLPDGALDGYAEVLLRAAPAQMPGDLLLAQFREAQVSVAGYAFALDPTGEKVLPLIEADPFRDGSPRPVLADGDWISLQTICAG